jgi:ABC-2 type transport system permease protein
MRSLRKLIWVELKLFAREPFAVIFTFGFPLVLLLVLIASFGTEPDDEAFAGLVPADYYLAAYVAVVIAAIGLIALPVHVASYRERRILRRFKASSVPATTIFAAHVVVSLLVAILAGAVLVVSGRLLYGTALPESPGTVAAAFVLGTLAFLALGFLVATLAPSARAAQAIGMILFFPMWLLSGAAPPPDVMGETMRRVSDVLPMTYVVRALQDPWLGSGNGATNLLVLAGILILATTLSIRRFRSI